ncbi:MAG: DUF4920 domain-containing protein [Pseudomonadota bacterium]
MKLPLLFITLFITSANLVAKPLHFGETVKEEQVTPISKLLETPENHVGKKVTVSGTIVGVCQKRGCWVDLASDKRFQKLRLKVRDGDMVFPLHTKGRKAIATGTMNAIPLSLPQTKHYLASLAKRDGEKFDPESVTEPMSIYQVVPVGVKILD